MVGNKTASLVIIGLGLVLAIGLARPSLVAAADTPAVMQKGLTISPLRSDLEIEPGTALSGTLLVTNSSDQPIAASMSSEEFGVTNQQYDYTFTADSDVAKWVSFSIPSFNLAAGETKQVDYTVGVPILSEPGGRYISLFVGSDDLSAPGATSVRRVASLLYITVLGNVSRAGKLLSLSSPWAINNATSWSATIQNNGTTHFRSRYRVDLKYMIGDNVLSSTSGEALILPSTVRSISDDLPMPYFPGVYKIIYTIGLGDTPSVTETRYFVYVSPLATIVILVALLAYAYWSFYRPKPI